MPFTFSHPAIILPFLKNKSVSSTALIVGSMSPDLEYFFRMKIQSEIGHTFLGIFLIDFPLGFIIMILFHEIIKKPLIENTPEFFQKRLSGLKELNWIEHLKNNFITVLISFFLGAVSHVFWDSMTHWNGYLVNHFPFFNIEIYSIPLYKIIQHLSSIIGIGVISIYFIKMPIEKTNIKKIDFNYWCLILLFSIVFVVVRFYFGTEFNKIGNAIVSVISSTIIAASLVGALFRNRKVV
ncbi:DUF4184 family protein [Flavobacterium undicola]|uniref:DUF4184 family protein n=1 Tax=Flavobacterium undicola TaxID=1932779 RepID=UPI001377AC07|nr:DUF4184 family protein [Flavobacterium undicola]MBA0882803.1 DUF4184 family protein [Flavobacterium undicola]